MTIKGNLHEIYIVHPVHLWDELSEHIHPVFIVSETAGVFYGLKKVLRPPRVFMEEEQGEWGGKGGNQ